MRAPLAILKEHGRRGSWRAIQTAEQARGLPAAVIVWIRNPTEAEKRIVKECQAHVPIRHRKAFTLDQMVRTCSVSTSTASELGTVTAEL